MADGSTAGDETVSPSPLLEMVRVSGCGCTADAFWWMHICNCTMMMDDWEDSVRLNKSVQWSDISSFPNVQKSTFIFLFTPPLVVVLFLLGFYVKLLPLWHYIWLDVTVTVSVGFLAGNLPNGSKEKTLSPGLNSGLSGFGVYNKLSLSPRNGSKHVLVNLRLHKLTIKFHIHTPAGKWKPTNVLLLCRNWITQSWMMVTSILNPPDQLNYITNSYLFWFSLLNVMLLFLWDVSRECDRQTHFPHFFLRVSQL